MNNLSNDINTYSFIEEETESSTRFSRAISLQTAFEKVGEFWTALDVEADKRDSVVPHKTMPARHEPPRKNNEKQRQSGVGRWSRLVEFLHKQNTKKQLAPCSSLFVRRLPAE